jgi:predicted nuclease of predicted toxin-antitoxin system
MSKKKHAFIIDNDLSAELKPYLPSGARTTVESGLRPNAPDYPDVVDLCQREEAMLVTADREFPDHLRRYRREQ